MTGSTTKPIALPVIADLPRGTRMGRRRAVVLVLVHLLIALHVAHYYWAGTTLSPVEPSEASYSLRNGAINAGAIFFLLMILSTLVLGRFFCGWACHLIAYQDLARWVLLKCKVNPRPLRSRLLMLVPLWAVYWLYGRPLVARWTGPASQPLHASLELSTSSFWATFPGIAMALFTFAVCGFVIVYLLGAKGFCTYGCPYGVFFGAADRAARGRIYVTHECDQIGDCTRNCSSNVDVAREVALYGKVVNPGCMKCMDCVSGCTKNALYFGFSPTVVPGKEKKRERKVRRRARQPREYDLSWREEFLLLAAFIISYLIYKDLYGAVPLLLAMGLSAVTASVALVGVRVLRRESSSLQNWKLKGDGRLTRVGTGFAVMTALLLVFLAHSSVMQWHKHRGERMYDRAIAAVSSDQGDAHVIVDQARSHLNLLEEYGLFWTRGMGRRLGRLAQLTGDPETAIDYYRREAARAGNTAELAIYTAQSWQQAGEADRARQAYAAVVGMQAVTSQTVRQLAAALAGEDDPRAAHDLLHAAHERWPADGDVALELCKLLANPRSRVRDLTQAVVVARETCEASGSTHADLLAMLAWLYSQTGQPAAALEAAEKSLRQARAQSQPELARDMAQLVEQYRKALE